MKFYGVGAQHDGDSSPDQARRGRVCDDLAPMTVHFSLASHPSFLRFWGGRVAGTMANQMLMVAVGWQMYDLTHSAWNLGLVGLDRKSGV